MEDLLKIEEVAVLIDSSIQTINIWYQWKRANPENEFALLLPDYIQKGTRNTRYWHQKDIPRLIKFKQSVPHGRNGVMGEITQRRKEKKNGKKKSNSRSRKQS